MADIFISYSKADRAIVELLAADLEREGWTVWFDRSLLAGDEYRDEIVKQLDLARAVIVMWTGASVKSDWVRSEAGRAKNAKKLIPVVVPPIGMNDVPPPFEVLHAEPIAAFARIKAAVEAQLAKPAVTPGALWLATRELRYQALTWFGIVSGAITVFASLSTLLKLADWARVLVTHWQAWTQGFWAMVFGWIGWQMPRPLVPVLTAAVSLLLIALAQRTGRVNIAEVRVGLRDALPALVAPVPVFFIGLLLLGPVIALALALSPILIPLLRHPESNRALVAWLGQFYIMIAVGLVPLQALRGSMQFKEDYIYTAGHLIFLWLVLLLPIVNMLIAPTRPLARRIWMTLGGLALLLALNELSKLGLDLTAPRELLR